jgi:AraC family transcriptional regulator
MNSSGNVLRQKQIGPFRLIEKSYSPGTVLAKHEHATEYVSFLLMGGYDETVRMEERSCPSGTVIWHPRNEIHEDRFHVAGGLLLDVEIGHAWLAETAQELDLLPRARMYRGGLAYSLGLQLYRALAQNTPGIEDVAIELLSLFFSGASDRQPPAWFQRALRLAGAIDDQRLSLVSLARETGVHPVHVARSFRRFLRCTFGDYVVKLRIRRALELLPIAEHTIADIAYQCGFADHAHLSRTFKKCLGITPSAYRRNLQAGPRRRQK